MEHYTFFYKLLRIASVTFSVKWIYKKVGITIHNQIDTFYHWNCRIIDWTSLLFRRFVMLSIFFFYFQIFQKKNEIVANLFTWWHCSHCQSKPFPWRDGVVLVAIKADDHYIGRTKVLLGECGTTRVSTNSVNNFIYACNILVVLNRLTLQRIFYRCEQ